ncbi:hypothetical protein HA466_0195360 [Hirschfeldia incana]|nr:hypothetical protein HA466_0195360 [Hirschfeldia incana]
MKVSLHYGGIMERKEDSFSYQGGFVNRDIVIDPDYMTWSMFEGFCEDNGSAGSVKHVWYKLPQETMDLLREISELTSDACINQMCSEAVKAGGVDIYVEQNVVERVDEEVEKDGEEERREEDIHEEERDEEDKSEDDVDDEGQNNGEQSNVADEVEEEIIEDGGDNIPLQSLFGDICDEEVQGEANGDEEVRGAANDDEEEESERQLRDVERPAPAPDTDDEWEDFNRQEKHISRTRYSNEKPPYLWLMQTFKSGEEFKDQLLRYVLKTNFDVKLCRWEKTKLGAICTKKNCDWKIYCAVEKPKEKWMVKSYVDKHNHLKSSKARMLKQGTIARLYKDEARRRPSIKWTDIKDEIMMRYSLSVSKWICTKARRMALDLVIETQREQFAKLWDYERELHRSNDNIKTEIVTILREDEPKTWCRAFFSPHARCEDVCNNLSESYNRTIREARKLPLINMLEEIRRLAMKRISRRREKYSGCSTHFPPNIMEIFEQNRRASNHCTVIKSSESLYEVTEFDCSYEVCLPEKHCACNRWDITGIPCQHVIYVINEHNKEPEDFVDPYYLTSRWQDTYRNNIRPVNGERLWEKTGKAPIQIPEKRRMPGRPKNYDRIKEAHESKTNPTKVTREGRRMTCSNCKQTDHNCGTCTLQAAPELPKRKRGRPRKTPDDPWSIQNAPKRKRNAQSQSTPTLISTQPCIDPQPSTAPQPSNAPTTRGRGRPRGRGRGCGRGRGRECEPPVPREPACYIGPYSGRVFEVWGPTAVSGQNSQSSQQQPQDS